MLLTVNWLLPLSGLQRVRLLLPLVKSTWSLTGRSVEDTITRHDGLGESTCLILCRVKERRGVLLLGLACVLEEPSLVASGSGAEGGLRGLVERGCCGACSIE